nr:2K protein [Apoi virus]
TQVDSTLAMFVLTLYTLIAAVVA